MPVRFHFLDNVRLDRRSAMMGGAFLGALVLSVLFFFLFGNARIQRVFFFPSQVPGKIAAEARFVPNYGDVERDIGEFVNGEILGPVGHDMKLLISREVTVRTLMVRSRVLYLDLSPDFAVSGSLLPLSGADALDVLRKSISFNFPGIAEIVFLVDGQAPQYAQKKKIR